MSRDETAPGRDALTGRQREIAALVARGYSNQEIAAELVITPGTAANHMNGVLRRLGLGSRSELAAWASERGLASAQNRLLTTLERLLEIAPDDIDSALDAAALAVGEALHADKVDAFLHDPSTSTLVARGTSPTPLGRKQHALGLHLGRRLQREGQDRHVDDIHQVVRTVERLDRLVRDLLDTARLEQGLFVLEPSPIDLVDLAQATAAAIEPRPGAVAVDAPMDELIVSADASRLRQVIENLLSNALKVQPEDEPVSLSLAKDDSYAILRISDHGPGIAREVLPNLFQRFGAGAGSGGLGLGLYLAHGITEAHNGSLQVESHLAEGTCFTLRLALERSATVVGGRNGPRKRARRWRTGCEPYLDRCAGRYPSLLANWRSGSGGRVRPFHSTHSGGRPCISLDPTLGGTVVVRNLSAGR